MTIYSKEDEHDNDEILIVSWPVRCKKEIKTQENDQPTGPSKVFREW